jgi:hypothetical protein
MMEELNDDMLKDALLQMPQYRAPDFIWDNIEDQLEQEGNLHQAIASLPKYTAPDRVWNNIEQRLQQKGILRRLPTWGWSAAAGVAIVITAALGIYQWNQTRGSVSYAYAVEKNVPNPSPRDWDADETDVQEVQNLYAHFCKYQSQNDMNCGLDQELKELNEAKAELKKAMAQYGEDPELIRQLGDLEIDRARVVKAMVEKIQTS